MDTHRDMPSPSEAQQDLFERGRALYSDGASVGEVAIECGVLGDRDDAAMIPLLLGFLDALVDDIRTIRRDIGLMRGPLRREEDKLKPLLRTGE